MILTIKSAGAGVYWWVGPQGRWARLVCSAHGTSFPVLDQAWLEIRDTPFGSEKIKDTWSAVIERLTEEPVGGFLPSRVTLINPGGDYLGFCANDFYEPIFGLLERHSRLYFLLHHRKPKEGTMTTETKFQKNIKKHDDGTWGVNVSSTERRFYSSRDKAREAGPDYIRVGDYLPCG